MRGVQTFIRHCSRMLPLHCQAPVGQGLLKQLPVAPVHVRIGVLTSALFCDGWLITVGWGELAWEWDVDIACEADAADSSIAVAADAHVELASFEKL